MHYWKKPETYRVSKSDPNTHPDYRKSKEIGESNYKRMKFKSEAERRDYLRAVEANPHNIIGVPAFFPPQQIKEFIMVNRLRTDEEQLEDFRSMAIKETELYCQSCDKITPHSLSVDQSFCKKCGNHSQYKLGAYFFG